MHTIVRGDAMSVTGVAADGGAHVNGRIHSGRGDAISVSGVEALASKPSVTGSIQRC